MTYTPWMAGSVAAAKRAQAAALARFRAEKREEYNEYRAEARICGYEVESFEEWMGEITAREISEQRANVSGMSLTDACYYGDM